MKRVYTPLSTPCVRCWHCCVDANYKVNLKFEEQLVEPWIMFLGIGFCGFLGVNKHGKPECLIYLYRPLICRMYHCEPKKNSY